MPPGGSAIKQREARYSDILAIARANASSFFDDSLFGDLIHPRRKEYPDDVYLFYLRSLRIGFWDYRTKWLVAVAEDANGKETIVGFAKWLRVGSGGQSMDCPWSRFKRLLPTLTHSVLGSLLKPLSSQAMRIHALIWPNRAVDPEKEDVFTSLAPFTASLWSGERAESWLLDLLAVVPYYQGKGVGRLLVKWGLDRAQEDGICASVMSAWNKDEFYRKAGFEIQDGSGTTGEGNPLADVPGGNVWWKMPRVRA
ncbi:acetyltransferase [Seiridium cupressi]